jgi:tetratricopeptide (TPR) repeat protein
LVSVSLIASPGSALARSTSSKKVYQQTVRASAGVFTAGGPASGWIVDKNKKWIITSQHVVGRREVVEVVFPAFKGKRVIARRQYYWPQDKRVEGKVLHVDSRRDLALIEVPSLPAGATALKLADDSAEPGEHVHLVGNPAASDALWGYSCGTVRQVYHKQFTYKDSTQEVDAVVGETQVPANPGDSGGPVVNDAGEVVGVLAGSSPPGVELLTVYIDVTEVKAFLEEAVKRAKVPPPARKLSAAEHNGRGLEYSQAGQHRLAVEEYSRAVRLDGKMAVAYGNRARAYLNLNDLDKAIGDCDKALKLDPKMSTAYNDRGTAWAGKGQYGKAVADYTRGIALSPGCCQLLANRGCAYTHLEEHDKAIDDLTRALRLGPSSAFVYRSRGVAYAKKGDWAKAIADHTEAIRLDPLDAHAHLWRSWANTRLGNMAQAQADYQRAITLDPSLAAV